MHAPAAETVAEPDTRRRGRWLGVLSVAALLLHAAVLSGIEWAWPSRPPPPLPAAVMQVRVVDAPAAPAEKIAALVSQPGMAMLPARTQAAPVRVGLAPAPVPRRAATEAPAHAPAPMAEAPIAPIQAVVDSPAASPAPTLPAAALDGAIPHYRTRMPPATTLRYEMQRGGLRGTGDLSWRPQGDHYELRLEARIGGLMVLTQVSTGGFDAAGIAPLRFTDQRLRRGTTAANFQRAVGKITFSGPSTEFALHDGAQDRLSWMVQLAAIVNAEPHLATPGAKVVMLVVGSHGDASVWAFRCVGPEAVETRAGSIDAIKFIREPRETYDTTVQVWLDSVQHGLPVRATQKSGPNDEGFDLRLQEVISSN